MANLRKELGSQGEALVARYLENQQFTIKAYNYAQRWGEIDLIALKGDLIAFVEVKLRQHHYFNLSEVIGLSKQQKIIRTARTYIAQHHLYAMVCRFDVALVERVKESYELTYIPNAFTASEEIV